MIEGRARPSSSRPLQLLLVGTGEQAGDLEEFVRAHAELREISLDSSEDFESAEVKLAERVYDLVLFAQDQPEAQLARTIQAMQRRGKATPLLFLPATLRHGQRPGWSAEVLPVASESALIRTIRGAVALGEPGSRSGKWIARCAHCTVRSGSQPI